MSERLDQIVADIDYELATYGVILEHLRQAYGWRAGGAYCESGASIADVIRYETEEYENDLDVRAPMSLLETVSARDGVWLCKTRREAREYTSEGSGDAYKVCLERGAFIAATDSDGGYLIVNR
jgi:predicted phage gp36 major capsid-like protein